MNYVLIGCGRIAANHIKAALANKLTIAAVCDVLPARMEALLAQYDLQEDASIRRYTDYRAMLAEVRPELASIATESGLHAQLALDCIDAGVHVIIEKPMAMRLADADEIIRRSDETHVKVCACHQNRFNLSVQEIRRAMDAGRFGKMSHGSIHVRWNRDRAYYEQAPWRGTWENDGGALMNQCIHGIDLLRWMLGDELEEVYAQTAQRFHDYLECEDIGMAVLRFKSGALGTVEGTTNVFPRNLEETLYLFGQSGTVKAGGKSCNTLDVWQFADEQPHDADIQKGFYEETENVYGNGHTAVFADMMQAIRDDRAPYIDARAGRRAVETVLAIYRSAATGQPVRLPLQHCASTDFIGRFGKDRTP